MRPRDVRMEHDGKQRVLHRLLTVLTAVSLIMLVITIGIMLLFGVDSAWSFYLFIALAIILGVLTLMLKCGATVLLRSSPGVPPVEPTSRQVYHHDGTCVSGTLHQVSELRQCSEVLSPLDGMLLKKSTSEPAHMAEKSMEVKSSDKKDPKEEENVENLESPGVPEESGAVGTEQASSPQETSFEQAFRLLDISRTAQPAPLPGDASSLPIGELTKTRKSRKKSKSWFKKAKKPFSPSKDETELQHLDAEAAGEAEARPAAEAKPDPGAEAKPDPGAAAETKSAAEARPDSGAAGEATGVKPDRKTEEAIKTGIETGGLEVVSPKGRSPGDSKKSGIVKRTMTALSSRKKKETECDDTETREVIEENVEVRLPENAGGAVSEPAGKTPDTSVTGKTKYQRSVSASLFRSREGATSEFERGILAPAKFKEIFQYVSNAKSTVKKYMAKQLDKMAERRSGRSASVERSTLGERELEGAASAEGSAAVAGKSSQNTGARPKEPSSSKKRSKSKKKAKTRSSSAEALVSFVSKNIGVPKGDIRLGTEEYQQSGSDDEEYDVEMTLGLGEETSTSTSSECCTEKTNLASPDMSVHSEMARKRIFSDSERSQLPSSTESDAIGKEGKESSGASAARTKQRRQRRVTETERKSDGGNDAEEGARGSSRSPRRSRVRRQQAVDDDGPSAASSSPASARKSALRERQDKGAGGDATMASGDISPSSQESRKQSSRETGDDGASPRRSNRRDDIRGGQRSSPRQRKRGSLSKPKGPEGGEDTDVSKSESEE